MPFWLEQLRGALRPRPTQQALAPGIYSFERHSQQGRARLHLRVESDGSALLIINAARFLHLNPSAAFMAHLILQQVPPRTATNALVRHYQVTPTQARQDYADFCSKLEALLDPDGPCPVCELDLETTAPFSAHPSAPYRMDLAITYRCNNACAHCYNDRPRNHPELSTQTWKRILDKLWQTGIPHIVFTGGEPTLRDDLPELIAYAEQLGQITGLNTNGRRLSDPNYLQSLVNVGLDHVQITLESHDPILHDRMVRSPGAWQETVAGIRNALTSRLYVMTNTTMLQSNSRFLFQTLQFLGQLGVPTIGLNALIYAGHGARVGSGLPAGDLPALLEMARTLTEQQGQRLIWYTPTQYCHFDPVQMDLGVKGCTAALYNMCIESDGSVLPCQSYYTSLGNILETPWEAIWNHELALSLRERRNLPAECQTCGLLPECGGGCPLERNHLPPHP